MDRRAAGALLALAACIASSVAAPTASDHTALDVYEGGSEGCYYNFQHYGEGHRIMTNEPCLNCTCHNRMLMCYLRVCPFTKAFGQDCTVEKRADQCCPIVTCPDVPVDLLTSTSTTSPAEYGATGLGKLDKYGCSINGKYFPEGSKVPPTPNKPCEHCYCIRNMTTCVMQECTLHVDGCTPIYHKDVCCPIRYSCDHPQDEVLLLDDMSTTVRPTPGFLLTTTTVSPVTQMSQDCVHNDQIIADGASITTEKACEHCYCMKGDIVCVVQECGAPMENEGKNCTSLPPREGQCCPDTYICEGDDISTEIPYTSSTDELLEKITTLLPPRKSGLEGSGYRNEPNEAAYTEMPYVEPELEGSGEEGLDATKPPERQESSSGKPFENEEITTYGEDVDQYIPVTTKAPVYKESETSTKEVEEETIEPQKYSTSGVPKEDIVDTNIGVTQKVNLPHESVTTSASLPEKYDQYTTESIDSLNTVPDISHEKEHRDHTSITTDIPPLDETNPVIPQENKETESATSTSDQDLILNPISEITSKPDSTPNSEISERIDTSTTERSVVTSEPDTQKENSGTENDLGGISEASITERTYTISPEQQVTDAVKDIIKYTESNKSEHYNPSTTNTPMTEIEKLTTELNVEQNTVIAVEKDSHYQHITETTEKAAASDFESTEKAIIDNVSKPEEHISTDSSVLRESESTIEPDKGLNTIPSEIDEESNTQHSLVELTVSPVEIATTKSPNLVDRTPAQEVEASSVPSEASTLLSESHITKSDHYTVTTEPSFRKEDEIIISTEKPKEDFGSTTIKTEFVDEGLIPTSIRDEKLSTNTDIPSTYEEMTTAEYNKELEESTSPKQDTTSPSILQTSATAEPLGEKVTATNELDITSLSSTEKSPDATSLMPVEDTHEEPSRIPGEGDCLLNGVTYRNNTPVPNTNNCHTGCKCVSSIIKCDPIICSPPPEYMNNCQSIYDTPDSCCPTYICDHPRETIPPQSDNQMSGTEAPIITPTIECRGDQCELSIPSKPTTPSESCSSDNCVSAPGDKSEPVSSECGPTGCDNVVKEPVEPSVEQPQCANGKCETSAENCANGKCQLLPTDSKLPSVKPCDGDDCRIADEKSQIPQLCENEESCKKIKVPISEPASNANCGSGPCDPNVISPPYANQPELCKENESCKPEDGTTFDCTGDKPCRRKDSSVAEMLPPKCEGDNCAQKIGTSIEQDISQPNTVSPSLETITETMVSVKDEKVSPTTDEQKSEQEQIETTTATQFVTEEQHVPTEFMVSKIDTETKPVSITEATIEDQKEVLTEPTLIEKVPTKIANDLDNYTETSISIGEVSTQSPKEIQNTEENQATHTPEVVKAGHTVKPPSGEQEDITVPIENDREQTDKQKPTDTEVTKTFDEFTHKPSDVFTLSEESISEISDVTRDYTYTSTQTVDFASDDKELTTVDTKKPDIIEQHKDEPIPVTKEVDYVTPNTDKPQLNLEKETELPSIFEKEAEHKITTVQEESTNIPSITETHLTEIPDVINEHTDKVIVTENHTDEPITVTEKETKTSDGLGSDFTDKPSITEEQSTKLPDITEKQHTDSPTSSEEESTKIPKATEKYYEPTHVLEDHNEEVPTINDFATKAPHVTEEQSYVPVYVTEKGTDSPSYAIDHSDKPTLSEEQDMKIPHIDEIEPDDKLIPVKEKSTKSPLIIEDTTEDSVTVPGIMKEQTDESTEIPEAGTETASVIDEYTNKPAVITENIIKSPQYDGKESYQTSSPEETEEPNDKKTPILFEEELPGKTDDMKEITEKKPDFNENEIVTEPMISEESGTESLKVGTTKKPVLIDETAPDEFEVSTEDSLIITEKPSTEKLNLPNDEVVGEVTEGPSPVKVDEVSTSSETEHTYKPEIFELHTNAPEPKTTEPQGHSHQTPDEEQSSTIAPGTFQTETKLPESETEVSTKTTDMKLEKVTEIPVHELQTTEGEEHVNTGPELITNSMITPEVISKSPSTSDSSVIVPQDSGSNLTNADNMETVTKQQETTDVLSTVTISYDTLPPLREEDQMIYQPSKDITPTQEPVTSKKEADEKPDITVTTELVEKVTKPTEYESDHEEKAGSTGIPEQEPKPSSTKSPTGVAIEPQEGEEPQLPDVVKAGPTDEQTSTKPLEDEDIKSSTPDSHVPGITVGTEYGHTTIIAETDSVTEVVERETPNIRLPETHDNDLLHISTNSPITTVTEDVKTDSPDVYIPQKEAMTTSITESTNTVAPTKGFTETEGVSITDEEHPSNVFTENTTDHLEVSTTAQNDISSETLPSISKTTNGPEQSYTDFYLEHTEILVQRESESTEAYEKSTTFKSSEVSQKTSNTDELVSEQPHRRTETIEQENTTPLTSEIQHSSITSTPTETTDNVAILEDKTTKTPESYPQIHSDVNTKVPEIYGTSEPSATESSEPQEPTSEATEGLKTTGSFYSESHMTDDQKTEPLDTENATILPVSPVKSDSETLRPETDVHKSSTEVPAMFTEILTEMSHTEITTSAPLSMVTEHQPDDSVTNEKHDDTKTTPQEIETATQQETTERENDATLLHEITTDKQKEITKLVDKTTAGSEYSETTPYLIELEEHTHKIIDDISTISPVDEKESTYNPDDVLSTTSTSQEHHVDEHNITPSPTEEEHTVKIEDHLSTASTSDEYLTHKDLEDTSPASQSAGDMTTATELHDLEKVTAKIPEEKLEIITKQPEIPSSSSEEPSTGLGAPDETLTESIETDLETKPARDQTTQVPTISEDNEVDKKDLTTSKPSQDLEVTVPAIVMDTEKSPIVESDGDVPSTSASSDKNTASIDESIFSTTKPTTVKQEELLTPSSEDKYSQPEEKPSSESFSPTSTAEVPKPPVDIEPTEEIPTPEDDGLSSGMTGYGEPDYAEEDQAFGPGTCRYGGKVYVSAQQIPRDDPCDFCFCFRSDIICLQQSCPPPIHGCHEEPIQGFCCPRYECPVSMATTVNVTTTTTTTTTTLPPHFPTHGYRGAAQRRGCQIKGHSYKVGEVVRSSSGPCLHCTCGGDGQMKCDPKACTPEPMLRQMIAAAVSAKRRR